MKIERTTLVDVLLLTPRRHRDERGHFIETFRADLLNAVVGKEITLVQDNYSHSAKANTVRGLHFQRPPHAQGKLVRCARGALLDVVVDIRVGSPTYKQSLTVELSEDNDKQIWVPVGFLHGFRTLTAETDIAYKCTEYYEPDCDGAIAWNDSDLAVDWGTETVTISDKDRSAQSFAMFDNPFRFEG